MKRIPDKIGKDGKETQKQPKKTQEKQTQQKQFPKSYYKGRNEGQEIDLGITRTKIRTKTFNKGNFKRLR